MIEMSVTALGIDTVSAQPVVILNDQMRLRALPIWIGAPEARAISFELEHMRSVRPLTHELVLNTIKELGYKVKHVEIDGKDFRKFFATIKLTLDDPDAIAKSIDARPSDAIAIALAADVPIYVSPQVLETATVSISYDNEPLQTAEFKKFVDGVKASDFNLPGISVRLPEDDSEDQKNSGGSSQAT